MIGKIIVTELPKESQILHFINKVDYQDSFMITLNNPTLKIEEIYFNIFSHVPKWIDNLLAFRNKVVGIFGLDTYKDAKEVTLDSIKVGNKAGIFKIYDIQPQEIIAGEDDSHLNFRVSVIKQNKEAIVSTVVKYNNKMGRLYMTAIMPFHKLVVKAMLKNALSNRRI